MTVTYAPNGLLASDFEVLELAQKLWEEQNDIVVSSAILILAFRVLVVRGVIPAYSGVVFVYNGCKILIDPRGGVSDYPDGWADIHQDLYFELI